MNNHQRNMIIAAIAMLALLFSLFSFAAFSEKSKPRTSARSAALYEPDSGDFLLLQNADEPLPMASTTKIMTALVAIEKLTDLSMPIEIDERAVGIEGSSAYFKGGEILTLYDLLNIMMLRSANDAATQIALTVSGSVEDFACLMNETAKELGLTRTSFTNPSGLDHKAHYTTARELAIITDAALKHDTFREIVSRKTYTATELSCGASSVYVNHNKLLSSYDGCIGVKTGYTKRSGRSLVSAAERGGVTLIAVTIDAPDDWRDHKALLDYGFSQLKSVNAVSRDRDIFTLPVVAGKADSVRLIPECDFSFVAKANSEITLSVDLPPYLIAPLYTDTAVGRIRIYENEKLVGEVALLPTENIEKTKTLLERIKL